MQKAQLQQTNVQSQPAPQPGGRVAADTPQIEQIAQLEAMIESNPAAEKLRSLMAMINDSPGMATQRRHKDMIGNSLRVASLHKITEGIHKSPRQLAARRRVNASTFSSKELIQRKTVAELDTQVQPRHGVAPALDAIRLANATLTIGATHTGDMYHLKAAKSIFPELNILIWGVTVVDNDNTVNKALDIGSYINDRPKTYYTDQAKPEDPTPNRTELAGVIRGTLIGWRKWVDEGKATSLILHASENSGDLGASERVTMAQGTAPIAITDRPVYARDLHDHGFRVGTPYILVNFRQSGHAGGTAPALDTGAAGYDEIIAAVQTQIGGATIVPMGELMPGAGGPFPADLIKYWAWPCCTEGREQQAGLLRYLNENFNIVGAVGMRSGIMDMLAFAGINILSIDISPSKSGNTSKGWERGSKLERALGTRYGRTFIERPRVGETVRGAGWVGGFHASDLATIGASVGRFLGIPHAIPADNKDTSHPLSTASLDAFIRRLTGAVPTHDGRMNPPMAAITAADRSYMNKIKALIPVAYTQVPNAVSYLAIINNLLRY